MNMTSACLPCRVAKAKCDFVRPACGRCTLRGITCSGFPVDVGFVFRDENEVARRNSKRARRKRRVERALAPSFDVTSYREQRTQPTTDATDLSLLQLYPWVNAATTVEGSEPPERDLETRAVDRCAIFLYESQECQQTSNANTHVTLPIQTPKLGTTQTDDEDSNLLGEPQWFSLEAFKENMAFTCLFSTCGWANFTRPWLSLTVVEASIPLSSICSRSLAIGVFGLEEGHKQSLIEAAKLYGTALGMLANSISSASRREAARLVAPVMALTFYTMCVDRTFFTSPRTHYKGLRHILEYCGPISFQDKSLLPAFEAARVLLTNEALIRRKRIFFEQRDWKVIPWRFPSCKSASSRVFDIVVDIPGILQDVDAMDSITESAKERISARVVFLKAQLSEWRWAWNAANRHVVREVISNRSPSGIEHPIFRSSSRTMLRFNTVTFAGDILLYNSALLWLMRLESVLFSKVMEPSTPSDIEWIQTATLHHPNDPLLLPGEARFFLQPAIEICRAVEDLLPRLTSSQDVSTGVALPIAVAYSFIQHDEVLAAWLRGMLDAFSWSKEPVQWWSRRV